MVYIEFIHFDIRADSRCSGDFLKYYDGLPELGVEPSIYCGENAPNLRPSSSNVVVLEFSSGSFVSRQGFQLTYRAINSTTGDRNQQVLEIMDSEITPKVIDILHIDMFSPQQTTQNTVLSIFLPRCHRCNIVLHHSLPNRDVSVHIVFLTYVLPLFRHFFFYLEIPLYNCGPAIFTAGAGVIESPHYPDPYLNDVFCAWSIRVDVNMVGHIHAWVVQTC